MTSPEYGFNPPETPEEIAEWNGCLDRELENDMKSWNDMLSQMSAEERKKFLNQ